jgi:hypothetical protein
LYAVQQAKLEPAAKNANTYLRVVVRLFGDNAAPRSFPPRRVDDIMGVAMWGI